MTVYYPMAETEDGEERFTYDSCLDISDCYEQFATWEDSYGYLSKMWIDVYDTTEGKTVKSLKVKKYYTIEEETK